MKKALLVAVLAIGFAGCDGAPAPGGGVTLEIRDEAGEPGKVEVVLRRGEGWPASGVDWSKVLVLEQAPLHASRPEGQAVVGAYELEDGALRFRPGFPLMERVRYRVRFDPAGLPGGGEGLETIERFYAFELPRVVEERPAPKLLELHPGVPVLPANHLKFYLQFSEPMQRGRVFDFLKLVRDDGEEVPEPFRDTELWSEEGRRFTLWFHPGRQKDGVNLNVEFGPVLEEGRGYRLVVSGDWKAESGAALGEDVEYRFKAGAPDRERVDVAAWKLEAPKAATRDRVRLFFPEPLDWALLKSRLRVQSAEGLEVAGKIEVGAQELAWFFLPDRAWAAGSYRVEVGTVLEDLAGNNLLRAFEVDLEEYGDGGAEDVPPETVYLKFEVE